MWRRTAHGDLLLLTSECECVLLIATRVYTTATTTTTTTAAAATAVATTATTNAHSYVRIFATKWPRLATTCHGVRLLSTTHNAILRLGLHWFAANGLLILTHACDHLLGTDTTPYCVLLLMSTAYCTTAAVYYYLASAADYYGVLRTTARYDLTRCTSYE